MTRTTAALAAQEEPLVDERADAATAHLVAGAVPAPDWSRLLLDAHAEGWSAVGPAVVPLGGMLERRRAARSLGPWAPGGRNPRFDPPLLLPSLVGRARARRATSGSRPTSGTTASSRAARSSGFRRDPVVDRAEDECAERQRDDRGDAQVDRVAERWQLAGVERRPEGLDGRRDGISPVQQVDEPGPLVRARRSSSR